MPRGRLIYPFLAEIARLDTAATAADPDGTGPLTSGYDEDFREPRKVPTLTVVPAEPTSASARRELPVITIRAQIEPAFFETLDQLFSGASPDSKLGLVAHYQELEAAGLVDAATGAPLIRINDRLVALRRLNGALIRAIPNPPGLYITAITDLGHGIGTYRNLLLLTLEEREQATSSAT